MYMFEWMYAASTFGRVFVLLFYNTMWPVPVVVVFVVIVADVTGAGCSVMVCSVVRRCYCFFLPLCILIVWLWLSKRLMSYPSD